MCVAAIAKTNPPYAQHIDYLSVVCLLSVYPYIRSYVHQKVNQMTIKRILLMIRRRCKMRNVLSVLERQDQIKKISIPKQSIDQ